MPLALTDEHSLLATVSHEFMPDRRLARDAADGEPVDIAAQFKLMGDLGWLSLHLAEKRGGAGYGLPELAIIAEQLGRAVAPLPFIPTVVTSMIMTDPAATAVDRWFPGLMNGEDIGGLGLSGTLKSDVDGRISGDAGVVIGGKHATVLCLRVGDDMVLVDRGRNGLRFSETDALDLTLGIGRVHCDCVTSDGFIPGGAGRARLIAKVLGAADAAGGSQAATDMAVSYAKIRKQFGRPIGSFQAIKHRCADMTADSELAVAAAWDAARAGVDDEQGALAAHVAGLVSYESYIRTAEANIQIHGGIGYTWEHDAHLLIRRARTLSTLLAGQGAAAEYIYRAAASGQSRNHAIRLPEEAEEYRLGARLFLTDYSRCAPSERRRLLAESGFQVPHWPPPFGLGAGPVEQLAIEAELSEIAPELPDLSIGGWVLLTLAQHANSEQLARWMIPGLTGQLIWCQLFSEPDAGSDAAAVRTSGVRVAGGWKISGQKVWTTNAQNCDRGLATIRTNRDAPKHHGITAMVIDLHAEGVAVKPLRDITGMSKFNEVYFDDVFVPDEDVVGAVDGGWGVARATLGNERVSIGGKNSGASAFDLVNMISSSPVEIDRRRSVSSLLATEQTMRVLDLRRVIRAIAGTGAGPEGSVSKLISAEHAQHVSQLAMELAGEAAVVGPQADVAQTYLFSRALTIAGGTSEINRNVIGEQILGLPR